MLHINLGAQMTHNDDLHGSKLLPKKDPRDHTEKKRASKQG